MVPLDVSLVHLDSTVPLLVQLNAFPALLDVLLRWPVHLLVILAPWANTQTKQARQAVLLVRLVLSIQLPELLSAPIVQLEAAL